MDSDIKGKAVGTTTAMPEILDHVNGTIRVTEKQKNGTGNSLRSICA
jgi:hypothetical protein